MSRTKAHKRSLSQRSEMIFDLHQFGILPDTREIFIAPCASLEYSEPESEYMIDHSVAHQFVRNLRILNSLNNKTILVHMMTCGGLWEYGMAIHNAIQNSCEDPSLSNIVVLAYAHARSMSSLIPQAATYRVIMPDAYFMMHHGDYADAGQYQKVVSNLKWSEKTMRPRMLDIYVEKCLDGEFFAPKKWTEKKIRAHLDDRMDKTTDFFLTARESVEYGLMDAVLGDEGFETLGVLQKDEEEEE